MLIVTRAHTIELFSESSYKFKTKEGGPGRGRLTTRLSYHLSIKIRKKFSLEDGIDLVEDLAQYCTVW